jgi:hypothetical protein
MHLDLMIKWHASFTAQKHGHGLRLPIHKCCPDLSGLFSALSRLLGNLSGLLGALNGLFGALGDFLVL